MILIRGGEKFTVKNKFSNKNIEDVGSLIFLFFINSHYSIKEIIINK
jgi:hypothetical protein